MEDVKFISCRGFVYSLMCPQGCLSYSHAHTPCFGFWIIAIVEGVGEQWRTNIRWGCGWTETNVSCHGMSGCVSKKMVLMSNCGSLSYGTADPLLIEKERTWENANQDNHERVELSFKKKHLRPKGFFIVLDVDIWWWKLYIRGWYELVGIQFEGELESATVNRRCVGYSWCWWWL